MNFRWNWLLHKIMHTTWTKASPTRCTGSQISKRLRSSSRNCWWMCRMAGTMRKISSTVWASMSDAFSCDLSGFKYFYAQRWEIIQRIPWIWFVLEKAVFAIMHFMRAFQLPWLPFPVIQHMTFPYWIIQLQCAFAYPMWKKKKKNVKSQQFILMAVLCTAYMVLVK